MKKMALLLFGALTLTVSSGQANDEFYKVSKYFIVETTKARLASFSENDIEGICNASKNLQGESLGSIDTKAYYLSFEMLDFSNYSGLLLKEVGQFAYMRYSALYEKNLPYWLHQACVENNSKKIKEVMADIEYQMMLE